MHQVFKCTAAPVTCCHDVTRVLVSVITSCQQLWSFKLSNIRCVNNCILLCHYNSLLYQNKASATSVATNACRWAEEKYLYNCTSEKKNNQELSIKIAWLIKTPSRCRSMIDRHLINSQRSNKLPDGPHTQRRTRRVQFPSSSKIVLSSVSMS